MFKRLFQGLRSLFTRKSPSPMKRRVIEADTVIVESPVLEKQSELAIHMLVRPLNGAEVSTQLAERNALVTELNDLTGQGETPDDDYDDIEGYFDELRRYGRLPPRASN